ncbi:hypothetical protein ACD661_15025 [Legionella lytica]|uniref:Uncharacterized protein n=1 Tax=Legionella lytica TaxID=96232 RepID=A0ABW8DAZ5_9GAMM
MPITTYPISAFNKKSGSGDFNALATYLFDTGNPSVSAGVGPLIAAPTANPSELGSGKWQGGLTAVYFNAESVKIQYGGLVTYQTDFAGAHNRTHTSLMAIQPFGFIQLGKGFYLRSAPIWVFDFKNDRHAIPLGMGLGKVIQSGKTVLTCLLSHSFQYQLRE